MSQEKSIDVVVRNLWGSWKDLYNMTKRDMEECKRRGVEDEIGTLQFKRGLIGNAQMSANDFQDASQAIMMIIKKIHKEQKESINEVNKTGNNVVTDRMIVDATKQELREMQRAGGKNDYFRTMFK